MPETLNYWQISHFRRDPTNFDADHCVRLQIVPFLIFSGPDCQKIWQIFHVGRMAGWVGHQVRRASMRSAPNRPLSHFFPVPIANKLVKWAISKTLFHAKSWNFDPKLKILMPHFETSTPDLEISTPSQIFDKKEIAP